MNKMKRNNILPELLSEIAIYLSKCDYFTCMSVSRHWYNWFKPELYKRVDIKSTSQFIEFLQALNQQSVDNRKNREYISDVGYFVKELRLSSYGLRYPEVILTQDKLNLLSDLCPRLELLEFDSSQWANITNVCIFEKWRSLKSTAPLHFKYIAPFISRLTHLHILHTSQDELFSIFPDTHHYLKHLTLDIFCSRRINLDINEYLQTLHKSVPQLESLCLIFTNSLTEMPSIHDNDHNDIKIIKLKHLSLKGISNPHNWIHYISNRYRFLESLEISQPIIKSVNTHIHSESLARLVQHLPRLKALALKGDSSYRLYSDTLIKVLDRSDIRSFDLDFNVNDLNRSTKFLKSISNSPPRQLQKLQVRVWNQFLGWPGSIQNLYSCTTIVDLYLFFARGFMDTFRYTQFVLDEFLENMPQIKRLCLRAADIQVLGNKKNASLEVLELQDSRIVSMKAFSQFISNQCVNQLSLIRCEKTTQDPALDLLNNRLDKLRLSTFLFCSGSIHRFLGVRLYIENQPELTGSIVWLVKEQDQQVCPSYRLATLEETAVIEKHPDLESVVFHVRCKSLRGLFVDDLKIPLCYFRQP